MEQLSTLAEIAIALAGFSSIIVVFRRGSAQGAWQPEDVFRLRMMLQYSLLAAGFAVAPAALVGLGVNEQLVWPGLSALLAVYLALDVVFRGRATRRLPRGSLNPLLAGTLIVGNVVTLITQLLNVVAGLSPGTGPYLFGVSWLTIGAGVMFYRLITAPFAAEG